MGDYQPASEELASYDMVQSEDSSQSNEEAIRYMNEEEDRKSISDRDNNELNIGATYDPMDGESDGSKDESEMSYMGEKPLESNWWDDLKNKTEDIDFKKVGEGFGGSSEASLLGTSGPNSNPGHPGGSSSYTPMQNPYGLPDVPKRGLKTQEYESMVNKVLGLLAKTTIRSPSVSSLV